MAKPTGSKGRGRNRNNNGKRSPGRGGNFDPNGGRNRGNAQQLMDKYLALARDASSQGDRIAAENYFQHADHYYRVVFARNEQQQEARRRSSQQHPSQEGFADPLPVQANDANASPSGVNEDQANSEGKDLSPQVNDAEDVANGAAIASPDSGESEQTDVPKPRRGRAPRKAKESKSSAPAPEAAE